MPAVTERRTDRLQTQRVRTDRYLMRELERDLLPPSEPGPDHGPLAIVGQGRLGSALARALPEAGWAVLGPLGRGADPRGVQAVLLCVPDGALRDASAAIRATSLVGHCSGASGLDVLTGHEAFSVHPLMSVTGAGRREGRSLLAGAGAAVSGATPRALRLARAIALRLGMRPVEVSEQDRSTYHAAASIASNFLITLEAAAERLAAEAGVDRQLLVPLVRATVENWAELGPERALTGPIARGDEPTVELQRAAVAERAPDLLGLFDAMVSSTRALAGPAGKPEAVRA